VNAPHTPLERVSSLKRKLSIVIGVAVGVTVLVFWAGVKLGAWPGVSGILAGLVALAVVFWLSRGLTRPVRAMAAASGAIARGDLSVRVAVGERRDEIGQLARTFNHMAAELEQTDRLRRDLVANVSHELRTPITALQVHLENLVDGVEQPDPETLRTMLDQAIRLGRLVEQLLDLSRLEAGVAPLEVRPFDVETMLTGAVRESRLQRPNAWVEVAVEPKGLRGVGDAERLHQVIANLVENALRYSPEGGRVDVHAHRDNGGVVFEVLDEGPGIAVGEAERVFERFYRADSARSSHEGGAGLGLAIARWVVDLHGGRIHAERRAPRGCRMVVVLPDDPPIDILTAPN
jgi:signal transduction histidine kinase